jgi:hypothetical protein
MLDLVKRKSVDSLVDQLWKYGYLTVKRKFGTYLPEPEKVGGFDVDIISKQKGDYAIGIALSDDDVMNSRLLEKITFLATRHTKFTNRKVILFLGVPSSHYKMVKQLVEALDNNTKKNIKLVSIVETNVPSSTTREGKKGMNGPLFA